MFVQKMCTFNIDEIDYKYVFGGSKKNYLLNLTANFEIGCNEKSKFKSKLQKHVSG